MSTPISQPGPEGDLAVKPAAPCPALRHPSHRPAWSLERWLLTRLLAACGAPPLRFELWDGSTVGVPAADCAGTIVLNSPAALRQLLLRPNIGFADGYSDGLIDIRGSLRNVLQAVEENLDTPPEGMIPRLLQRFVQHRTQRRSHSLARSRDSVHHHYDLGNDFYRLWLDKRMQYTCAYYPEPGCDLDQAQFAKLEHVCRKLQLRPGDTVLEAGCGWGGLAVHMAERYGVTVRAFNLSREQLDYARAAARRQNLESRIEFIEDDYRNASGTYDAFVSIGMLEHVGLENYGELGRIIDRTLTPAGRGLLHSIGRNRPQPIDAWSDKRIFPGAYPPSLCEMLHLFEPIGCSILDVENLRLHYARTLEHWLERFEHHAADVRQMFDERFVRMWRMYLTASIVAFEAGSLQLFQIVFTRQANNDIPWTRRHLYDGAGPDPARSQ